MNEIDSPVMDFQQSDQRLVRIEKISLVVGLCLALSSLYFWQFHLTLALSLGAALSTLNFRLLWWGWGAVLRQQAQTDPPQQQKTLWPRLVLKYFFLLVGLLVLLLGLKLNLIAFGIGLGNIFLAVLVDASIPSTE